MISEEEKDVINDLKILCDEVLGQDDCYRYDNYSASEKMTMVSIVLNLLQTQNRMINVLADKIYELDVDCTCDNFLPKDWKCMEYRTCKECIKEWARKKIENEKKKIKEYQHKYYLEVTKKKRQEKRNQTKAKESE